MESSFEKILDRIYENEGDCEWIIVTDFQGFCIGSRGDVKDELAGYVAQLIKLSLILFNQDTNNMPSANHLANPDKNVSIALALSTYGGITLKARQNMILAVKKKGSPESLPHHVIA